MTIHTLDPISGITATESPRHFATLHGLWGSASQFFPWEEVMGRPIIAPDLWGHGVRSGNLDGKSLTDYANDAFAEIDRQVAGQEFDLLGHSAGGLIAQMIAAKHPDQVKSLILLASDPPRSSGVHHLPLQIKFARKNVLTALMSCRPFALTDQQAEFTSQGADVTFGPESGRALKEILTCRYDVPREAIRCPVTVIAAEDDQFLPIWLQQKLADHYQTKLVTIPGPHMAHVHPKFRDFVVAEVGRHLPVTVSSSLAA